MNNGIDSVIDEDVATMLPTVGLNGTPLTKDSIIHTEDEEDIQNKMKNKHSIESEVDIMQDIEFSEAVINYMNDPNAEYDEFVSEGVLNIVDNVKERVVVSNKTCKLIVDMHMLKKKIHRAEKSDEDGVVTDLKRELIQKQRELNQVKKTASPQLQKEIEKMEESLEKKTQKYTSKDLKTESVDVSESDVVLNESVDCINDVIVEKEGKTLPPELKRLDELRGQIENLEDQRDKAKSQLSETGEKIYENKIKGLTAKIDKLKKELAAKEKEAEKIQGENVKESEDVINESQTVKLDTRINFFKRLMAELEEKINEKKQALGKTTLAGDIKTLQIEKYELTKRFNECKKNLDKLELQRDGRVAYASTDDVEYDSDVITEAANMEGEIKPIVDKLNSKGYKVKYASPGHKKLRKKEDAQPDGVYYSKLYSDARVMFDDKYSFPDAPKYWHWRDVDGCSYLDITPINYDKSEGTPDEAFAKWKDNYMDSLKSFVDGLKDNSNKEIKESVDEFANSFIEEMFEKMGINDLNDSAFLVNESVNDIASSKNLIEELDNLLA